MRVVLKTFRNHKINIGVENTGDLNCRCCGVAYGAKQALEICNYTWSSANIYCLLVDVVGY